MFDPIIHYWFNVCPRLVRQYPLPCSEAFPDNWWWSYWWRRLWWEGFAYLVLGFCNFGCKWYQNIIHISKHPKWGHGLVDILNEKLKIFFSTSTPQTFSRNIFDESTRQIRQTGQITNNRFWLERLIVNICFLSSRKIDLNWKSELRGLFCISNLIGVQNSWLKIL